MQTILSNHLKTKFSAELTEAWVWDTGRQVRVSWRRQTTYPLSPAWGRPRKGRDLEPVQLHQAGRKTEELGA